MKPIYYYICFICLVLFLIIGFHLVTNNYYVKGYYDGFLNAQDEHRCYKGIGKDCNLYHFYNGTWNLTCPTNDCIIDGSKE